MNRFALILLMSLAASSHAFGNTETMSKSIIRDLGQKGEEVVIYNRNLTFFSDSVTDKQVNDATLEYYYLMQDWYRESHAEEFYVIQPSNNFFQFNKALKTHKKIDKEMKKGTIFSFLYFEDGDVIYDHLPPEDRFNMSLSENSYFASNSMGKSIVSYMYGYAICKGHLTSIDDKIENWPLMERTLYHGQPILNLLNMSSGDSFALEGYGNTFKITGGSIHDQPLKISAATRGELLDTKPKNVGSYSYSNLTSNVLINFLAHKLGENFEEFLREFYQSKIGVKFPIYMNVNKLRASQSAWLKPERTIENITEQGAWKYGLFATRYDYLRIAKAILDDWKLDTCEGKYLKRLYKNAIKTGKEKRTWKKWPEATYPNFGSVAQRYAGQFHTKIKGLYDKTLLVMIGSQGQQIVINLDDERIIVIAAGQQGWYNTKSIAYDLIKTGKIKSGNWN